MIKYLKYLSLVLYSSCAFLHTNLQVPKITSKPKSNKDTTVSFRFISINESAPGVGENYHVNFVREKDCSVCIYLLKNHNFKSLEYINPILAERKVGEFLYDKLDGQTYPDSKADYHIDIYSEFSGDLSYIFTNLLSAYTLGIIPSYNTTEQIYDIKIYSKDSKKSISTQFRSDHSTWGSLFLWFNSDSRLTSSDPTTKDIKEGEYILYQINEKISEN